MFNFFKFAGIEDRLKDLGADQLIIDYVLNIPEKNRGFFFKTYKENPGIPVESLLAKFDQVKSELTLKEQKIEEGKQLRQQSINNQIIDQIVNSDIKLWTTRQLIKNKNLVQDDKLLKDIKNIETTYEDVLKTFFKFDLPTYDLKDALLFCNYWQREKGKIIKLNDNIKTELNNCSPKVKEYVINQLHTPDDFDKNSICLEQNGDKKIKALNHWHEEEKPKLNDSAFPVNITSAVEWEAAFTNVSVNLGYEPLNTADIVYGPINNEMISKDPDLKEYLGYFIISLEKKNDYIVEGKILNHCLGTSHYYDRKERGEIKVFSLRTPQNMPKVTIQTSSNLWRFDQTFAYGNKEPSGFLMNLINKWKKSLHPIEQIKEYALSSKSDQNIQVSQFIEENDNESTELINLLFKKDKSKSGEYRQSASANNIQSVLEGFAQNESLNPDRYEKIFELAKKNNYERVIFHLARNKKISNEIMNNIFALSSNNTEIMKNLSVNMSLKNNPDLINKLFNSNCALYVMYNLMIPSSIIMNELRKHDMQFYSKLFNQLVSEGGNFEKKVFDDLLFSIKNFSEFKPFLFEVFTSKFINQFMKEQVIYVAKLCGVL